MFVREPEKSRLPVTSSPALLIARYRLGRMKETAICLAVADNRSKLAKSLKQLFMEARNALDCSSMLNVTLKTAQ
jgi:hypothetical protein